MKKILFIGLILTQSVFAGTFTDLNVDSLIDKYSRAEVSIGNFNPNKVSWGQEINALKADHTSESCGEASVEVSRRMAIRDIRNFFDDVKLADALESLVEKKIIIYGILGQDGFEGESEYCSRTTMKFYAKDGEVLEILYDFNT